MRVNTFSTELVTTAFYSLVVEIERFDPGFGRRDANWISQHRMILSILEGPMKRLFVAAFVALAVTAFVYRADATSQTSLADDVSAIIGSEDSVTAYSYAGYDKDDGYLGDPDGEDDDIDKHVVPEPATLALYGTALAVLQQAWFWRRRRLRASFPPNA